MTIIPTYCGQIQGKKVTSTLGTSYLSFTSIPYMKAPVGNLRFRDPQPMDPWNSVLDCTKAIESYCNYFQGVVLKIGKEDSAILNVYAPENSENKNLPVLVDIHGGGFQSFSSKHDFLGPDYWMERNIIYVSFNYRLGPLGFLSLKDPKLNIPGNMGLKDQVQALKWVQKNIRAFGGDPNNVTIYGESAGGVSVHLHMLSEKSKGLFQKAIILSGSAFDRSWSVMNGNDDFAERLAKSVGWDGSGGEAKILQVLEKASPHDLMKKSAAQNFFTEEEFAQFMIFSFTPVVEPFETENCFLPKHPIELTKNAWSKDLPILIGGAALEGTMCHFLNRHQNYVELFQDSKYFTPSRELKIDLQEASKYGDKLKKFYFGDSAITKKELRGYLDYAGDRQIWHGLYNTIKSRAELNNGKTFAFYFDAETELNFLKKMSRVDIIGASHGDFGSYIHSSIYQTPPSKKSTEFEMIEKMTKIFESFFASGMPKIYNIGTELTWKPVSGNEIKYLSITEKKFEMIPLPFAERLEVWNSIYKEKNIATM